MRQVASSSGTAEMPNLAFERARQKRRERWQNKVRKGKKAELAQCQ